MSQEYLLLRIDLVENPPYICTDLSEWQLRIYRQ